MNDKRLPLAVLSARGMRSLMGNERPGDPSAEQSQDDIANYYRNASEGDAAVIRETYARRLWFIATKIVGKNPRFGRVYLAHEPHPGYGGVAFHIKSGRNYAAPKGQSSLVMPTPEVLQHAEKFPFPGENVEVVIA